MSEPFVLVTYLVMIANCLCPQPNHAPKWNEHAAEVREQKHSLGLELKVSLNIPEPKGRGNGTHSLRNAEVGEL